MRCDAQVEWWCPGGANCSLGREGIACARCQAGWCVPCGMEWSGVCRAMQCTAMQCKAMRCIAVQYNAMECNGMQWNAMECSAMQCNAMADAVQYNAMECSAMQWRNAVKPSGRPAGAPSLVCCCGLFFLSFLLFFLCFLFCLLFFFLLPLFSPLLRLRLLVHPPLLLLRVRPLSRVSAMTPPSGSDASSSPPSSSSSPPPRRRRVVCGAVVSARERLHDCLHPLTPDPWMPPPPCPLPS